MSVNSNGYIHLGGNIRNIYILLLLSLSFGTVTDNLGNIYQTVQIGEQLWMAENLKVNYYNNGDEMPLGYSNNSWPNLSHGAWTPYGDINGIGAENREIYGLLYNWYAIDDERGICPEGLHIPSQSEMEELIIYIGELEFEDNPDTDINETYYENSQISGGKAKETGTEHWESPNTGATNESGFTGLPAGWRDPTMGYFYEINQRGLFWLSTLGTSGNPAIDTPMKVELGYNHTEFWIDNGYWNAGYSVRCMAEVEEGCTHPNATNYDETANVDDGNCVYETVQIGHQVWMQENLKATHYRNGDAIPYPDNVDWGSWEEGHYAVYDNDYANSDMYGNLYNWSAVDDERGICPEGFHVPTNNEFEILTDYLGGEEIAGGKLKEEGTEHWNSPNVDASNESGFTAVGGGVLLINWDGSIYGNLKYYGNLYSSSEYSDNQAWLVYMHHSNSPLWFSATYKHQGNSVRCLSDETLNTTILVPDNFATIQEAIDYSIDGDTVLVSAGTYVENINFNGKNIALIGEDRETTIIDGGQNGSVVTFNSSETNDALLDRFTITNGNGNLDGSYNRYGGGIYCSSSPKLTNLIIEYNSATVYGGGIYFIGSDNSIAENIIIHNNTANEGGGILSWNSNISITNAVITDNSAENSGGGGIGLVFSSGILNGLIIMHNSSNSEGAGIIIRANSNFVVKNCLIANNIGNNGDLVITDYSPHVTFVNTTIYSQIDYPYYGIRIRQTPTIEFYNSIIDVNRIWVQNEATIDISYTFFETNEIVIQESQPAQINYLDGVISGDPQFTDLDNGDFTLQPSSPCIDSGDPESNQDPDGTRADMGAYPTYQNSFDLHAGANLISFYVLPDDKSVTNMLSSLGDNATGIIGEGVAASQINGNWSGSLTTIAETSGYWVTISEADELRIFGEPVIGSEVEYELHSGANLVSYPYEDSNSIESALTEDAQANLTGIIGEGVAANNSSESGWMGSLDAFGKNRGYWLTATTDFDMYYNEPTSLARQSTPTLKTNYNQSSQQAFYFIESIENIEQGDIIHTYSNGINVGSRVWNGGFTDVPAMGDDGSQFTAGYCTAGSIPTFKVEKANGSLITLTGDIPEWSNNQLYMVGYLEESIAVPAVYSLSTAYPNPFNPTTTLSFAIPVDSEVSLSVYNLQGREVSTLIDGNMDAGYHSVIWDANSYASGVYFVKMVTGEYVNTQKLMLVK